jgi:hypothetical protein
MMQVSIVVSARVPTCVLQYLTLQLPVKILAIVDVPVI